MSSGHITLDAAATDRKARLAKLASLKRKQPGTDIGNDAQESDGPEAGSVKQIPFISGRNYDFASQGPKLGFENVPGQDVATIEQQAEKLELSATEQAAKDEAEAEEGIDLFKLQPKKPNWDLKRDLAEKMKVLDVRTQNAIARLVKERIQNAKKEALQKSASKTTEDGEEVGIEGNTLVEGIHQREREEEEAERRDKEIEEEDAVS